MDPATLVQLVTDLGTVIGPNDWDIYLKPATLGDLNNLDSVVGKFYQAVRRAIDAKAAHSTQDNTDQQKTQTSSLVSSTAPEDVAVSPQTGKTAAANGLPSQEVLVVVDSNSANGPKNLQRALQKAYEMAPLSSCIRLFISYDSDEAVTDSNLRLGPRSAVSLTYRYAWDLRREFGKPTVNTYVYHIVAPTHPTFQRHLTTQGPTKFIVLDEALASYAEFHSAAEAAEVPITVVPLQVTPEMLEQQLVISLNDRSDVPVFNAIAMGGTFDHMHDGHRYLLAMASLVTGQSGRIVVGVTSAEMLKKKKYSELIESEGQRCQAVRSFLNQLNPNTIVEVSILQNPGGGNGNGNINGKYAGPGNINCYIVEMMLNAANHGRSLKGQLINFPVLTNSINVSLSTSSNTNHRGLFDNIVTFGDYLHTSAQGNPTLMATELETLLNGNHA